MSLAVKAPVVATVTTTPFKTAHTIAPQSRPLTQHGGGDGPGRTQQEAIRKKPS
jgi:hypothetical protein